MLELNFVNLVNNIQGTVSNQFIEKYLIIKDNTTIITPSGISVLIKEYEKRGEINIECKSCRTHEILRKEIQTIIDTNENITKGFIVKSKDPYHHLTAVLVKKEDNNISILITDTQGGEKNYDPSTLFDAKDLKINRIFNLWEKRETNASREGAFAFHDLLLFSKYPSLIQNLESLNKTSISLDYLPEVKFTPVYLNDLPPDFSQFVLNRETLRYDFNKYVDIIKNRLKYEYHVKTTYDGDIITPRGLNMLINLVQKSGELKIPCIAVETHSQFRDLLISFLDGETHLINPFDNTNNKNIQAYMVRSRDPHDHMTPVYFYKGIENSVILSDTAGGQPHWDYTVLWDLENIAKQKQIQFKIYVVIGRRQFDNNTCPIFSFFDIIALNNLPNDYFEEISRNRKPESLYELKGDKYPKIKYIPIYLNELPVEMMMLTNRYATLEDYAQNNPQGKKLWELVSPHIVELPYKGRIIKSNAYPSTLNSKYAKLIRENII